MEDSHLSATFVRTRDTRTGGTTIEVPLTGTRDADGDTTFPAGPDTGGNGGDHIRRVRRGPPEAAPRKDPERSRRAHRSGNPAPSGSGVSVRSAPRLAGGAGGAPPCYPAAPVAQEAAELDRLRGELARVDGEILDAWARREAITGAIGRVKEAAGAPIHDGTQEERVVERARSGARARNLPEEMAVDILRLIMRSALARQEGVRLRARRQGEGRRALLIGGAGRMGRWFARFLGEQGFRVAVADPAVSVKDGVAAENGAAPEGSGSECHGAAGEDRAPAAGGAAADDGAAGNGPFRDWSEAPDDFDLTVVAAPLAVTAALLPELAAAKRRGLLFDIGSVKGPLVPGLREMARRGLRVASVHPMFGPDTRVLHRRHVLVLDAGDPEAADAAAELFSGTMAEILRLPLAEHDPLIAYVLGLSHALNLAFLTAVRESGEQAPRLARLSSVTFDRQMAVAAAVARENPNLYFEIQRANAHGDRALRSLAGAVNRLADIVRADDEAAFCRLMREGRDYVSVRA